MSRFSFFSALFLIALLSSAQDDLMDLLDEGEDTDEVVTATFKGSRLVNGHSVEVRKPGELEFLISHRFGEPKGINNFYGLDGAQIRLGLEYGVMENLNIGIGRSSVFQVIDGFVKYRLLQQSNKIPFTVTAFGSLAFKSDPALPLDERKHRSNYTGQVLIARKFSSSFSMQVMPTLIQRNLVPTNEDENGLIAIGVGGRMKLNQRTSLNVEWYPQLTDHNPNRFNSFAVGFDIETGGHVFQLHLTNAQQMYEAGFIGETGDETRRQTIHFGFNISRVFQLGGKDW